MYVAPRRLESELPGSRSDDYGKRGRSSTLYMMAWSLITGVHRWSIVSVFSSTMLIYDENQKIKSKT